MLVGWLKKVFVVLFCNVGLIGGIDLVIWYEVAACSKGCVERINWFIVVVGI